MALTNRCETVANTKMGEGYCVHEISQGCDEIVTDLPFSIFFEMLLQYSSFKSSLTKMRDDNKNFTNIYSNNDEANISRKIPRLNFETLSA